jgi:excinuclease ABC subunit C
MTKLIWHTITAPKDAPTTPGVYMYLQGREIIYIGKSVNLRARLRSHAQSARLDAHERLIQDNQSQIKYTLADSDFLATLLEAQLIQKHLPRYNRILRDNKSYLYIVIDMADDFPKPRLIRHRDLFTLRPARHASRGDAGRVRQFNKKHLKAFGPFATRKVAEDILRTIRRLIPFCQQKRVGSRACFYHKLGLCNPCPSKTNKDPNLAKKYRAQIRQLTRVLSGNLTPVLKELQKQLQTASQEQDFETALNLRNRLTRFQDSLSHHSFHDGRITTYSSTGQAIQELSSLLSVDSLARIECYDASTFQLKHSVVSLVVTTNGQLDKSQYRRFKIKNPRARSDFAMLKEALSRRLANRRWKFPNLIVIDGGLPQLRVLQPLLDQLDTPPVMIGLAKRPDRLRLLPDTTLTLPTNSPALHLLQLLRNESHRFANQYRKILERQSASGGTLTLVQLCRYNHDRILTSPNPYN